MLQAELKSRLDEARQKIPTIKVDWHPNAEPRSTYNASKLALIIEPRPLPHLVPQMLHMISVVPPDWRFLFIGSNLSVISVGRSLPVRHQQVIGKLDLMVLPEPWEIDSKEHVFRLLTDVRFYDEFLPDVEHILKYESDSILCANSGKSLDEWLEWSWVGAPRYVKLGVGVVWACPWLRTCLANHVVERLTTASPAMVACRCAASRPSSGSCASRRDTTTRRPKTSGSERAYGSLKGKRLRQRRTAA